MNNEGGLGITAAILLVTFILIAVTAVSVIMDTSPGSEQDLKKFADEAVDEISTYLQIKDVVGKYYNMNQGQKIQKIAMLIKPLFSTDIDISYLTIKISNGEQIRMLYYSGEAEFIENEPLFEHPIWQDTNEINFSLIVTLDKDKSITSYDTINDYTDTAYVVIRLPEEFTMKKGDSLTVTLFLSPGITRTITVTAPLPMKPVVSFD